MENEAKIERIKTLMENFGVTQSEFAKRISIDASNFSKHLTGKLPVSDSLINRIVADLGVSKEWLCTGKGYMFRPSDNDAHSHIRTLTLPSEAIIPEARNGAKVYGLDVTAGNLARDRMFTEDLVIGSIDVPFINPDCSIVKVSGDSMKPVINNGDMIAIREIKNPQLIFWGQIYVILLEDYRMVKYIRKHDNPDRVIANRQRLCRSLGIDTLISPRQIHGTKVLSITDEFIRLSKSEQTACLDGVDAVMTDCPSVAIAMSTADCVPVLLYDTVHRACAAVHAGWRGMAGHIVRRSIDEMVNMYGTVPSDLYVAVGPSIGPDNFEVGDEVVQTFDSEGFDVNRIAHRYPSGRFHIDLWAAAVEELTVCGVDLSRIEVAGICTRAHDWEFFSARSLGFHSGRFLTGIYICP